MSTIIRRARLAPLGIVAALLLAMLSAGGTLAYDSKAFSDSAFQRTWDRTDHPVEDGQANRTWMWGLPVSGGLHEDYANSPGGTRLVQYFDKSRMEITNPNAVDDGVWFVTNGLLVRELITGQMQLGDDQFEQDTPADVGVAGDPDDTSGPTYAALAGLLDAPAAADGATLTQRVDREGNVTNDPSLASMNVTAGNRVQVPGIDHQIATPFWSFMNSSGVVYQDGGFVTAQLFVNPFYATGFPITEAYWANVKVAGTVQLVLLQCFERRCLTYTPGNPAGWQVEAGNVGQHYYEWRYGRPMFSAELSGGDEVPGTDSGATGTAAFILSPDHTSLMYRVSVSGISNVVASHIHLAPKGQNGDIVVPLYNNPTGASSSGLPLVFAGTFTDADLTGPLEGLTVDDLMLEIMDGNTYVNVHTTAHPGGEIRGQIGIAPNVQIRANLTGDAEVPATGSAATGTAWFQLDEDGGLDFEVDVENIQDVVASHIHLAPAGQNGDIVVPLFAGGPTSEDGILAMGVIHDSDLIGPLEGLTVQDLLFEIMSGNTYVNVHTSSHPGGEIRGQIELAP